jgi:hypothetical protein
MAEPVGLDLSDSDLWERAFGRKTLILVGEFFFKHVRTETISCTPSFPCVEDIRLLEGDEGFCRLLGGILFAGRWEASVAVVWSQCRTEG